MNVTPVRLHVEIASDLVCPWCFVGKRRYDKAARAVAGRVDLALRWMPFQLDATVPPEGRPYKETLVRKFGSARRIEEAWARLTALGREEGIAFDFARQQVMPSTLRGHRLVAHAQSFGDVALTDRVVEGLFAAHFCEGRDTGDAQVLADVAAAAGLDRAEVAVVLASEAYEREVREEITEVRALGVTAVPTFVVDRRYGVAGAQPSEALVMLFDEALGNA